ncbi:amidohydrolase family protein [Lacibacter sediminis]|uniref:Amidohydrolase family protein n=1 Tax=Lacibacter sediminis TaxID=2760713 RepID=A0A7G5XFC6_9BACT|nr:amidohydrolase family protein [Lacibacter sediminis]QNA44179.1 amidohydrolase family protein [Lacibacter sediminis]
MKKLIFSIQLLFVSILAVAQETVYPAKAQSETITLTNATIHVGNGTVITNGSITFENGKIKAVGQSVTAAGKVIDAKGKHIYPGLILSASQLGLAEISSVRATIDHTELGLYNSNIRSIVAYNTDSKVIATLRSNGILFANVVPQGGTISGTSSVVQLDAWNWEDATYKADGQMHMNMPNLLPRPSRFAAFLGQTEQRSTADQVKEALGRIEEIKGFFREAKAYHKEPTHAKTNLKFEATKALFEKKQKLFVHCDIVKEMLVAIDFAKEFGFDVVIVGGSESWQIADLLKQNNIAVILAERHALPTSPDDDVDLPYKSATYLQDAGVLFAINDTDGSTRGRNLPFNAGTAAGYGITKEQALSSITLNAAKILGIDKITGSLEVGKDANIVVSEGDILDMRSSIITHAFIQGRQVSLDDKHKQLNERYKYKYGIK